MYVISLSPPAEAYYLGSAILHKKTVQRQSLHQTWTRYEIYNIS